jgi:hypothetical protein
MLKTTTDIARAVLERLSVNIRQFVCKDGVLFFCRNPGNDLTFDLKIIEDKTIRLWRYVSSTSISNAGARFEYCNPCIPNFSIGIEVTEEGNVTLYAELKIEKDDPQKAVTIEKIITGYIKLISDSGFIDSCLSTAGL